MKERDDRLLAIREIIENQEIGSQNDLVNKLQERGFVITQATLSRDLRRLNINKVSTGMGYKYILGSPHLYNAALEGDPASKRHRAPVMSVDFSGNFAVIKTRNGYATGLAYDIDMSHSALILGTIAGADTVFAIMREGVSREQAVAFFEALGEY